MSSQAPRASILVPVFNSVSTMRCCLGSAQAQTLADIGILVADDASTDDSAALAEAVACTDPRVLRQRQTPASRTR